MKQIKYSIRQDEQGVRIDGNLIGTPRIKNGIVNIPNHSTGSGHSCHPNIDSSGSVRGMKKLSYWNKNDVTVRAHGYIYNKTSIVRSDALDYIAYAIEYHPDAPGVKDALIPNGGSIPITKTIFVNNDGTISIL